MTSCGRSARGTWPHDVIETKTTPAKDQFNWVSVFGGEKRGTMADSESSSPGLSAVEDMETPQPDMFGYGREPRYTAEELTERSLEDAEAVEEEAIQEPDYLWRPASRVGNTNWCDCSKCSPMPNRLDCLCCQDAAVTLELAKGCAVSCVVDTPDFPVVVLHKAVLTTALRGYFEMKKQPMSVTEQPDNRYVFRAERSWTSLPLLCAPAHERLQ